MHHSFLPAVEYPTFKEFMESIDEEELFKRHGFDTETFTNSSRIIHEKVFQIIIIWLVLFVAKNLLDQLWN